MATDNSDREMTQNLEKLEDNLDRIEGLTTRLVSALSTKREVPTALAGPGSDLYFKAASAWVSEVMSNPAKLIEHQVQYWGDSLRHYIEAQSALAKGKLQPPQDTGPEDRRFKGDIWNTHPYFNFIKQQYLLNAAAVDRAVQDIEGLENTDRQRLEYFTQQIVDMFSPTNFLATNPEALAHAAETDGQSLVDGLENLVRDIEAGQGELRVTLADKDAFSVGENIATTEGEVVFRNHMFELIQYAPTTEKVHHTPLIIFPPWINKFYILDLKPQNSLIRWIVEQGYTLFVVSWINPDASYADVGMEDYIEHGYLRAIAETKAICGTAKVNAIGYCIAGTTLALTLALMQARKDKSVNSATFFTTMTDFSEQGEFGVFLQDDFVDGLEEEIAKTGVLDSFYMQRTFSFLRSNDLIYGPAIQSYMMGKTPPAFDLLYWNGDGTNLPGKMAVEYLRGLCQGDKFANGGIEFFGETLRLADVKVPLCAIACETDHIAAWDASYAGIQQMGSKDKTFILSGSGHIAGIVNPPAKRKYGHRTHDDLTLSAEEWKAAATAHEGSWWPMWEAWLAEKSGKWVKARVPGAGSHPALAPAPGTYVRGARPGT